MGTTSTYYRDYNAHRNVLDLLRRVGVMAETHCFVADDHSYLWMFSKEEMGD